MHQFLRNMPLSLLLLSLFFAPTLQLDYSTLVHLNASCYPRDTCSTPRDLDDPSRHTCDCSALCALHNTCCIDAPALRVLATKSLGPVPSCRQVSSKKFYFMQGECRLIKDHPLARRCERDAKDWADPFGNIPVTNVGSHTTYKNVFCALCNGEDARNLTMWQVSLDCAGLRDDMVLCHENKDFILRNMVYIRDKAQWGIWLFIDADWVFRPLHLSPRVPDAARTSVHPCRPDVVSECHPEWPEDDRMWTLRERNERQRATRDLDVILRSSKDNSGRLSKDPNYQLRTTDAPLRFPSDYRDTLETSSNQYKSSEVPLKFPNDNEDIRRIAENPNDNSRSVQNWPGATSGSSDRHLRTTVNPSRTVKDSNSESRIVMNQGEATSRSTNRQLGTTGNPTRTVEDSNSESRIVMNQAEASSRSSNRQLGTTGNPSILRTVEDSNSDSLTVQNSPEAISRFSNRQLRTTVTPSRLKPVEEPNLYSGTVMNRGEAVSRSSNRQLRTTVNPSRLMTVENPNLRSGTVHNSPEVTSIPSNSRLRTTENPSRLGTQEDQNNRSRTAVPNMTFSKSSNNQSNTTENLTKLQTTGNPNIRLPYDSSRTVLGSSNNPFRSTEKPVENLKYPSKAVRLWTEASNNISTNPPSRHKMGLREACGSYMGVVHYPSATYRNVHCAICNFEKPGGLICDGREGLDFKGPVMNFGMLLDIDLRDGSNVGRVDGVCEGESQVFDPFSKKCRTVECGLPGYVLKEGKCVLKE